MTDFHPNRTVLFAMLGVIIGAAIQFAVQYLVARHGDNEGFTWLAFVTTLAFILNAINFYHGKSNTLNDPAYVQALFDRPTVAIFEFLFTTGVILCFAFLAFDLTSPWLLRDVTILCRVLDIALIILILCLIEDREPMRGAQKNWLKIDIGVILVMLVAPVVAESDGAIADWIRRYLLNWESEQSWYARAICSAYILTTVIDVLIDYFWLNKKVLYTENAPTWRDAEIADHWDTQQLDYGDYYREKLILPALIAIDAKIFPPDCERRVLDVGCGNGCVARALAGPWNGRTEFTCIDSSEALLTHAAKRNAQLNMEDRIDLKREPLDICSKKAWRTVLGSARFNLAIACFTLQDCQGLKKPLRCIYERLEDNGLLIVVYENGNAFSRSGQGRLSSRRPWSRTGGKEKPGQGERWIITWNKAETHSGNKVQTVTRFWAASQIRDAAEKARFTFEDLQGVEFAEDTTTQLHCKIEQGNIRIVKPLPDGMPTIIASYAEAARFGVAAFRKPVAAPPKTETLK